MTVCGSANTLSDPEYELLLNTQSEVTEAKWNYHSMNMNRAINPVNTLISIYLYVSVIIDDQNTNSSIQIANCVF